MLPLGLVLVGCANLQEVRDYAGESAKLAAYKDLTTHFRDTYSREAPYLSGAALAAAQANDSKRQAAYGDLIQVHNTVARYMMTLATVAGDKSFDLSQGIDAVTTQIKAHPDVGLQAAHVDAISTVAKLVSNWHSAYYQQDAVKDMVRRAEAGVQISLEGMANLLRMYRKTHDNERKQVLGLFETEFALAEGQAKDPLLMALARAHYQQKAAEFAATDGRLAAAERAIGEVARGHTQLYRHIDDLSTKELKDGLARLAKDLKSLREQIQTLQ
jgi:hypothetical protein